MEVQIPNGKGNFERERRAVTLVGGQNGDAVCSWKDDSQEHVSSAMNTIIHICIFRSSNTTEAFLALFLISFPFTTVHFCINVHYFILKIFMLFNPWLCVND